SGGGIGVSVDSTPVSTAVTDTIDTTTVTLSSTTAGQDITEGGSIVYTATVDHPVTGSPLVVTLSNGQTITIPVNATSADSAAFNVRADNVHADAPDNLSVSIVGTPTGGNYEDLATDGTVTHTVVDDTDSTTLSLSATATVSEGGAIVYTATLTNPTDTAMSVTLSNGAVINIGAGASSGTISVPAPTDDVYLDAGSVSATIA